MKGNIIIILFTLLVNCYGSDGDPGSTTYCRTIDGSSVFFDKKCEPRNEFLTQILSSPAVLRCLIPGRVVEIATNICYSSETLGIFYEITQTGDAMKYSRLNGNKISASDGKSIAAFDGAEFPKGDPDSTSGQVVSGAYFKKIFEFDPINRTFGKEIWNQDPNDLSNKQTVANRSSAQKNLLVPMATSVAKGIHWLVAVQAPRIAGYSLPEPAYFQLIEVKE
jgi:hypothetical protein